MATVPDVYIIESLSPDDEGNGRLEGVVLAQVLRLHGKNPRYKYVRTRKQFANAVSDFGKSRYRYLHISAHADEEGMCTTNRDDVSFSELADFLTPHLKGRRLFLSACSMVHDQMAKELIPSTGCYSVVGPTEDIRFTDAAVVWASIYHLMFTSNDLKMVHAELKRHLVAVRDLFNVDLAYYSASKKLRRGYTANLLA